MGRQSQSCRGRPASLSIQVRLISIRLRLAEVLQSNPERSAGELDEPAIWLVHFEDQIDRTSHRQRSGEERDGYTGVRGGKKAEARENYDEPKH